MSSKSSSSSSSADSIARHFIQKYYTTLHNAPKKVPSIFYSPFAHRATSYVSNGNNNNKTKNGGKDATTTSKTNLTLPPKNEVQDSRASLQSHFTSHEKYYMDLNTTISSLDASEVTFVQDKTLLVLVKGAFSSSNNLGEEKSRRNFSQTFLLTTARGGGRVEHGQYHQQQQQQQQEQQHSYEFVCTNELLQLSREHQIDKGVGTRDTGADLYDGAVKVFPPSTPKPVTSTPRKQEERQQMAPTTPIPAPRPTGRGGRVEGGRRTSFGDTTTKHEMKFIEKQIDALYTEKKEHRRFDEMDSEVGSGRSPGSIDSKKTPPPGYEKTKPLGDVNLAEAKQQLLAELKQKKKPTPTALIKQTSSSHVVFVKNIHFHTPASAMRREFSKFGDIISIDFGFPKDDFGEERKKFCFIEYASRSECEAAVAQSSNIFVDSRRLIVQHRTGKGQQSK